MSRFSTIRLKSWFESRRANLILYLMGGRMAQSERGYLKNKMMELLDDMQFHEDQRAIASKEMQELNERLEKLVDFKMST